MRFTFSGRSLLLGVYAVAFSVAMIGCTADQMARVQDGTKKVQDTATIVATAPVPPNPVTDWAGIIAAGAGAILVVEKAVSKYLVPAGVAQAQSKNVGGSQSGSTTVLTPPNSVIVNTPPNPIPVPVPVNPNPIPSTSTMTATETTVSAQQTNKPA